MPAGQASVSNETTKVHSRPHAKVTQQVTWYIPSPHSETNVTTKQRPFSVLAGPSQENRLTQSNVPPWFGTQQEARIRPLPKRSQQKKNEPVQFFQGHSKKWRLTVPQVSLAHFLESHRFTKGQERHH